MKSTIIGAAIGNVSLVFLFMQALINPAGNKELIENTSYFYFITEIVSLAAYLTLIKFKLHPEDLGLKTNNLTAYDFFMRKIQYFSIICFFSIMPLFFAYLSGEWLLPVIFSLSLFAKAYSPGLIVSAKKVPVYSTLFLISIPIFYFYPDTGIHLRGFTHQTFVDNTGQTNVSDSAAIIIWGIFYYGIVFLYELYSNATQITVLKSPSKRV